MTGRESGRERFRSVVDLREGEGLPAGLMALYGFLALASFYLIKPVRNSVFVERVGSENLPYLYVATAAVVIGVTVVYSRRSERMDRERLFFGTLTFLAANLVLFWWLLRQHAAPVVASGAFYVWGKLYPLILVSQFWLLGNLLFTTRQAKRLLWLWRAISSPGRPCPCRLERAAANACDGKALRPSRPAATGRARDLRPRRPELRTSSERRARIWPKKGTPAVRPVRKARGLPQAARLPDENAADVTRHAP